MTFLFGQRYRAGYGVSTVLASMDFETYSEAGYVWNDALSKWTGPPGAAGTTRGLEVVGAAAYTEHPSCEVLCFNYNLKDGRGPHAWAPGMPLPVDLFEYMVGHATEAWNVAFERWVWRNVCMPRYGWPLHGELRCAMAKARAYSLPGKLERAGAVMQLTERKNAVGKLLLRKFSVPRQPTKTDRRRRVLPVDDPEGWRELLAYNAQDVVSEDEASIRVPDLTGEELEFWKCDQAINLRGVAVDLDSVAACIDVIEQARVKYDGELHALTGGAVARTSEVAKLTQWLAGHGLYMDSLDAEAVDVQLERLDTKTPKGLLPVAEHAPVYRALELRRELASANVKKVYAMRNRATADGRLHDLFNYYATRTGRATGEAVQPTNMAKAGPPVYACRACGRYCGAHHAACPWCNVPFPPTVKEADWTVDAVEDALRMVNARSLEGVEWVFGNALETIAGCLRGLFVAAPGHDLICSDYSAIEAVVLAAIAGETWRLDVFRTHGKIYEASAAMMAKLPVEDILAYKAAHGMHHPLRDKGKRAELACGYQGWVGAWIAFGADKYMTEEEMKQATLDWRAASPAIVELWGGQQRNWRTEFYGVEGAAIEAIGQPGKHFPVRRLDGTHSGITFYRDPVPAFGLHDPAWCPLYCTLPSGRALTYHAPRVFQGERKGLSIEYEGWNTNPKNGPVGWIAMRTWGGRLVENITQATARDILRHAIVNLERVGYPVVIHVYDEIASEVPEGLGSIEQLEKIMSTTPPWAHDWPIKATGGWRGKRYRKG